MHVLVATTLCIHRVTWLRFAVFIVWSMGIWPDLGDLGNHDELHTSTDLNDKVLS